MKTQSPLLGILGGMGPQAGLDLAAKLIASVKATSDQEHAPFVLFSMPGQIADRTAFLRGETAENPAYAIAGQLEIMASLGVTRAVMACNTAHAAPIFDTILEQLQKKRVGLRLLHLVDETAAWIRREFPRISRVGVLATPGAYQTDLYGQALRRARLDPIVPEKAIRDGALHAAIYDPKFGIKATPGGVSQTARELVLSAVAHVCDRGAEAVLLGCTELPLVLEGRQCEGVPLIDPARVVAERLLELSSEE